MRGQPGIGVPPPRLWSACPKDLSPATRSRETTGPRRRTRRGGNAARPGAPPSCPSTTTGSSARSTPPWSCRGCAAKRSPDNSRPFGRHRKATSRLRRASFSFRRPKQDFALTARRSGRPLPAAGTLTYAHIFAYLPQSFVCPRCHRAGRRCASADERSGPRPARRCGPTSRGCRCASSPTRAAGTPGRRGWRSGARPPPSSSTAACAGRWPARAGSPSTSRSSAPARPRPPPRWPPPASSATSWARRHHAGPAHRHRAHPGPGLARRRRGVVRPRGPHRGHLPPGRRRRPGPGPGGLARGGVGGRHRRWPPGRHHPRSAASRRTPPRPSRTSTAAASPSMWPMSSTRPAPTASASAPTTRPGPSSSTPPSWSTPASWAAAATTSATASPWTGPATPTSTGYTTSTAATFPVTTGAFQAANGRGRRRLRGQGQPRRLGPGLRHLPRRRRPRQRPRHRRRRRRQRLRDRRDHLLAATFPTTDPGVPGRQRRGLRRLRGQAEPRRLGPGLRHLPGRQSATTSASASPWTGPATPT